MSKKRYIVPDGMYRAADEAITKARGSSPHIMGGHARDVALEAAVRWLAENPIVPTVEQSKSLIEYQSGFGFSHDKTIPEVRTVTMHGSTMRDYAMLIAVEWQRRMFLSPEPQDNSAAFISKLQGYTFTPEEAAKIKHAIDTATHPRTVNGFDEHLSTEATPFQTPYPRYSAVESLQDGYPSIDSDGHYQCQVCATRIDHLGNCQRHSSESDIVDLMNRRMVEYSDWVHTNLQNLFDKKPLAPRLEWDKRGRKVFTYADVVKTKRPTYCAPGTRHPFDPSHRECPGCELRAK